MSDNEIPASRRFIVTIEYWPDDGDAPTADDVFLAVQDSVGDGRLAAVSAWSIVVELG